MPVCVNWKPSSDRLGGNGSGSGPGEGPADHNSPSPPGIGPQPQGRLGLAAGSPHRFTLQGAERAEQITLFSSKVLSFVFLS